MALHFKLRRKPMRSRHQRGWVYESGARVKKWYGQFYVYVRDAAGNERRLKRVVVLGDKAKLRKWEAQQQLEQVIAKRTGAAPASDDSVTLRWFTESRFLPMREGGWRESTARGNKDDIERYILSALGDKPLASLDQFKCQTWLNGLAKKLSRAVVARARVMLKAILELAVELEFLRKNPARHVQMPECRPTAKPVLAKESLALLLSLVTDTRDHLMLMLAAFCALRTGELFGLKWAAYNGAELVIESVAWEGKVYDRTKTGRAPIPVAPSIRAEIDAWREICPDDSPDALMFPSGSKHGRPLSPPNFMRDCVEPIIARWNAGHHDAKLPTTLTFQILRRSAATRNRAHGTMKDVQELLRHSSIETTANVYMQPASESVAAMVEADIADVLGVAVTRRVQ